MMCTEVFSSGYSLALSPLNVNEQIRRHKRALIECCCCCRTMLTWFIINLTEGILLSSRIELNRNKSHLKSRSIVLPAQCGLIYHCGHCALWPPLTDDTTTIPEKERVSHSGILSSLPVLAAGVSQLYGWAERARLSKGGNKKARSKASDAVLLLSVLKHVHANLQLWQYFFRPRLFSAELFLIICSQLEWVSIISGIRHIIYNKLPAVVQSLQTMALKGAAATAEATMHLYWKLWHSSGELLLFSTTKRQHRLLLLMLRIAIGKLARLDNDKGREREHPQKTETVMLSGRAGSQPGLIVI